MLLHKLITGLLVWALLADPAASWAAHPLITDDAGTQGKGNFQLELNGQYDSDKESVDGISVKATGGQAAATLSYGIDEHIDLVASLPYQWGKIEENDTAAYNENGITDMVVETKWRFFEKNGFSLALKPGISIPTGDDVKGLGAGKLGGHLFLLASKEIAPWAVHANLGYVRNENKADEQENIWHASLAATWEAIKDFSLVADIGIESNPDDNACSDPAFVIAGIIYSVAENVDLDCGVKYALNASETDCSLMAGMAIRF